MSSPATTPAMNEETTTSTLLTRALGLFLACATLTLSASAQKLLNKDLPPNHPENDPYTRGDPELSW